ncbi:MAG: CBS domain-containing protein [Candidatus Bathyarchaeia archaeon]
MSERSTNAQSTQDQNHILQAAIISGIIFVVFWILSSLFARLNVIKPDSTLLFIALIPFIVWLILSGRITKIVGPGGWVIEFGKTPVAPIGEEIIPVDPGRDVDKGTERKLQNNLERISEEHPTILSFEIGKEGYYALPVIWKYVQALETHSRFHYALFVDSLRRFKGIIEATDFERLSSYPRERFVNDVPQGFVRKLETTSILVSPGVVTEYLQTTSTNKEALELMEKAHTDYLPVVNEQSKFVGVVTQERIVRKILLRLLST